MSTHTDENRLIIADMDYEHICAYCQEKRVSLKSEDVVHPHIVLVCSQVCSDKFWTERRLESQEHGQRKQQKIGFLVSSDPGFLPGIPDQEIDQMIRVTNNLPYAPVHQWFTERAIRTFENYRATQLRTVTLDDSGYLSQSPPNAKTYEDELYTARGFNYHHGLMHLYLRCKTLYPNDFKDDTSFSIEDLAYYNFSARSLTSGVIWNDAATLGGTDWRQFIDRDVRTGDRSYIRHLVKTYNLTDDRNNFLSQEYHYNPAIHKLIALGYLTKEKKMIDEFNKQWDEFIFSGLLRKLKLTPENAVTLFTYLAGQIDKDDPNSIRSKLDALRTANGVPAKILALLEHKNTGYLVSAIVAALSWFGGWTPFLASLSFSAIQIPSAIEHLGKLNDKYDISKYVKSINDADVKYAQSHPDAQRWHSMARPYEIFKDTVGVLRESVLDQLRVWFSDAIDDHSEFHLGHVFHCIQDSYSRSHTRRQLLEKPQLIRINVLQIPGGFEIKGWRHTRLLGFQQYDIEDKHPPGDSWFAAIGRNPETNRYDEEFSKRSEECISMLQVVAALYYCYWLRLATLAQTMTTDAARDNWKRMIKMWFDHMMRQGPFYVPEEYENRPSGGAYRSIIGRDVILGKCEKLPDEKEPFCYLPTDAEKVVYLATPIEVGVVYVKGEDVIHRTTINAPPSLMTSDFEDLARKRLIAEAGFKQDELRSMKLIPVRTDIDAANENTAVLEIVEKENKKKSDKKDAGINNALKSAKFPTMWTMWNITSLIKLINWRTEFTKYLKKDIPLYKNGVVKNGDIIIAHLE